MYCPECRDIVGVHITFDYEDSGIGRRHKVEFWSCERCGCEELTEQAPEEECDPEGLLVRSDAAGDESADVHKEIIPDENSNDRKR